MRLRQRFERWLRRDGDIEEEMATHLSMARRNWIERGESPSEAYAHARREFGNRVLWAEETREVWGWAAVERFTRDFVFGLRGLRRQPGFAVAAVLIVALGVGANTAVFSVVNELLICPLPYHDANRIVDIATLNRHTGESMLVSEDDFKSWHEQSGAFAVMALHSDFNSVVKAGDTAEFAFGAAVSSEFFRVFGLSALRGRLLNADDFRAGDAVRPAVVSEGYWRDRLSGDPNVVGRVLHVGGNVFTIVGVAPAGLGFPRQTEIWLPLISRFRTARGAHNFRAVGRLKPDIPLGTAAAEMHTIATRLEQQYIASNRDMDVQLTPLRDRMVAHVRPSLLVLCGAVAVVLLIACVNLTGILLVRSTARSREMAIRLALGASRWRLTRQLLAESLALAVPIGVLALLLAGIVRRGLFALAPEDFASLIGASLGTPALFFAAGLSVLTALLFGCVPAWQASRLSLNAVLKQFGGRTGAHAITTRLRATLVVGEVALSVVLLAAAGLLVKSFVRLQNVELGFHPEHVMVMTAVYPTGSPADADVAARFHLGLVSAIQAIPGVQAAGAMRSLPGSDGDWSWGRHTVDYRRPDGATNPGESKTVYDEVTPGAIATLGVPLLAGRDFTAADTSDAPPVAIINETLARRDFPRQNAIGHTVSCGLDENTTEGMRIVGVVGDTRQFGPASPVLPAIYLPNTQHSTWATRMHIVARSTLDAAALQRSMRRAAHDISHDVPVKFFALEDSLAETTAPARFRALLVGAFAVLALALAMIGVYGVMAYLVAQRGGEIGVRMALGADTGAVFELVLKEGLRLTVGGLALGLVGAVVAMRALAGLLFDVQPNDPHIYAGLSLLLGLVALAAIAVPAWRATRVDPAASLRQE